MIFGVAVVFPVVITFGVDVVNIINMPRVSVIPPSQQMLLHVVRMSDCMCLVFHTCALYVKAIGWNEMLFGCDTHVVPSNIVSGAPVPRGKWRFGGRNPKFAAMQPITKLLCPIEAQSAVSELIQSSKIIIMIFSLNRDNS